MLKVAQINLSDIAWYEIMLFENSLLIIRATPCRCKPSFLPAWSITKFWCSKASCVSVVQCVSEAPKMSILNLVISLSS